MNTYTVHSTPNFDDLHDTLDGSEQKWIKRMKESLKNNQTGKIIRVPWFREKKYLNKWNLLGLD